MDFDLSLGAQDKTPIVLTANVIPTLSPLVSVMLVPSPPLGVMPIPLSSRSDACPLPSFGCDAHPPLL